MRNDNELIWEAVRNAPRQKLVNKSVKAGDWIKIEGNGWWASPFYNIWSIDGKVVNVNDNGIEVQYEGEIELCEWNEIDAIYDVDGVVWERE